MSFSPDSSGCHKDNAGYSNTAEMISGEQCHRCKVASEV